MTSFHAGLFSPNFERVRSNKKNGWCIGLPSPWRSLGRASGTPDQLRIRETVPKPPQEYICSTANLAVRLSARVGHTFIGNCATEFMAIINPIVLLEVCTQRANTRTKKSAAFCDFVLLGWMGCDRALTTLIKMSKRKWGSSAQGDNSHALPLMSVCQSVEVHLSRDG